MRDEDQGRVGAQRFGLRLRPLDEFGRRHADRRNAARLEFCHVMRTARYAGPSVAKPLDDQVDFGGDLLLQRQGRGPRVRRLLVALDREPPFAPPPARTIMSPPGRNLLTLLPASEAGPPSAMPLAPATNSSPGISHSR